MTKSNPILQLLLGVIAISFSATLVKYVPNIHPTVSAFYRTFYSTIILLSLSLFHYKTEWKPNNLRWMIPSLWAGIFLAADLILWHKTILYIGSGPATLIGNSQIIFVSIFAFLFFKEKFSTYFLLFLPLIFMGLYWAIPKTQIMISPQRGFTLGLIVGLTYAGFLIGLRYAKSMTGDNYPEILSLAFIMMVTTTSIGGYALGVEHLSMFGITFQNHVVLFLMGLIPQSLGWILIKSNLTKFPSHQGSLTLLLQPILTIVWGTLLFHEPLGPWQISGMLLALVSLGVYQFRFAQRTQPSFSHS
jgi:drug/metabolite transporter (DMT)-like permease